MKSPEKLFFDDLKRNRIWVIGSNLVITRSEILRRSVISIAYSTKIFYVGVVYLILKDYMVSNDLKPRINIKLLIILKQKQCFYVAICAIFTKFFKILRDHSSMINCNSVSFSTFIAKIPTNSYLVDRYIKGSSASNETLESRWSYISQNEKKYGIAFSAATVFQWIKDFSGRLLEH